MRTCPKCGAYYADDSLAFCLADGTPLADLNPLSEKWREGFRTIEEKAKGLRKHKRKLMWRRIVVGAITTLILTMVVANSFTVETTTAGTIPPIPTPFASPSVSKPPLPPASPTPCPTPSPSASPSPSATPALSPSASPSLPATPTPSPSASPSPYTSPSPSPSPTLVHKISGQVVSEGKPLSGVKISLEGSMLTSTTTDADGNYTFGDLRAGGSYTITPRAGGSFSPASRYFDSLRRDEPADFLAQSDANECSEVDMNRQADGIVRDLADGWERTIKGERDTIIAENVPDGIKNPEVRLGRISYQIKFLKPCKVFVVTATYAWQVNLPANPASPGSNKSVPKAKKFTCGKLLGVWGCSSTPATLRFRR